MTTQGSNQISLFLEGWQEPTYTLYNLHIYHHSLSLLFTFYMASPLQTTRQVSATDIQNMLWELQTEQYCHSRSFMTYIV